MFLISVISCIQRDFEILKRFFAFKIFLSFIFIWFVHLLALTLALNYDYLIITNAEQKWDGADLCTGKCFTTVSMNYEVQSPQIKYNFIKEILSTLYQF